MATAASTTVLLQDLKAAVSKSRRKLRTLRELVPVRFPQAAGASEPDIIMYPGSFGSVFKMQNTTTGEILALKCFLNLTSDGEERYNAISAYLAGVAQQWLLNVRYYKEEISVNPEGRTSEVLFPVLSMRWVEGPTLGMMVEQLTWAGDQSALHQLAQKWALIAQNMLGLDFSHGDLKADNILVEGRRDLVLVDYDSMFVPALAGKLPADVGGPAFQHPERQKDESPIFDKTIDHFPMLVIGICLRAFAIRPALIADCHESDKFLFCSEDFKVPDQSKLLQELVRLGDAWLTAATRALIASCNSRSIAIPDIGEHMRLLALAEGPRPSPKPSRPTQAAQPALKNAAKSGLSPSAQSAASSGLGTATAAVPASVLGPSTTWPPPPFPRPAVLGVLALCLFIVVLGISQINRSRIAAPTANPPESILPVTPVTPPPKATITKLSSIFVGRGLDRDVGADNNGSNGVVYPTDNFPANTLALTFGARYTGANVGVSVFSAYLVASDGTTIDSGCSFTPTISEGVYKCRFEEAMLPIGSKLSVGSYEIRLFDGTQQFGAARFSVGEPSAQNQELVTPPPPTESNEFHATVSGFASAIDTGTLRVVESWIDPAKGSVTTIRLHGISGLAGIYAQLVQKYLDGNSGDLLAGVTHGGRVDCALADASSYTCRAGNGRDLGATILASGAGRAAADASEEYRKYENDARLAKRGIWATLDPPE